MNQKDFSELTGFILQNKDTLHQMIEHSEQEGKEEGVLICKNDKLTFTPVCQGEQCKVILRGCNEHHTVGSFHTHPRAEGDTGMTGIDYIAAIKRGEEVVCYGQKLNGEDYIVCDRVNQDNLAKAPGTLIDIMADIITRDRNLDWLEQSFNEIWRKQTEEEAKFLSLAEETSTITRDILPELRR